MSRLETTCICILYFYGKAEHQPMKKKSSNFTNLKYKSVCGILFIQNCFSSFFSVSQELEKNVSDSFRWLFEDTKPLKSTQYSLERTVLSKCWISKFITYNGNAICLCEWIINCKMCICSIAYTAKPFNVWTLSNYEWNYVIAYYLQLEITRLRDKSVEC